MDLSFQRRIAASLLGVGESRVWIDPEREDEVAEAITKEDVRNLIDNGVIRKRPQSTPSRGRARVLARKKSRGQRAGPGSRKGSANARRKLDDLWVNKVRKMRAYLRELRERNEIDSKTYRALYMRVKGNAFASLSSLKRYLSKGR
ncbi:MAG: 50S ribosomal protein L19e [Thermoprotei archaeon]|jgi:large subunit ribosomal protein L19e